MNAKTSKLISLYVGMRAKEGKPVTLRGVKRRYRDLPWNHRGGIKEAMASYIVAESPSNRRGLRLSRPKRQARQGQRTVGVMRYLAMLLGLSREE